MADENTITVTNDQMSALKNRIALNKSLFIAVLIISIIVLSIMGTGLTVMYSRINVLTELAGSASDDTIQQQISTIEKQIFALDDFRKEELKQIAAFTEQLELTAKECSSQKTGTYQELLIKREADFQTLLKVVKSGASSLASMSKGSKKWLESHNSTIDSLSKKSADRKQSIETL